MPQDLDSIIQEPSNLLFALAQEFNFSADIFTLRYKEGMLHYKKGVSYIEKLMKHPARGAIFGLIAAGVLAPLKIS